MVFRRALGEGGRARLAEGTAWAKVRRCGTLGGCGRAAEWGGGVGPAKARGHPLKCGGEVMGHPWGLAPGTDQVLWRERLPQGL